MKPHSIIVRTLVFCGVGSCVAVAAEEVFGDRLFHDPPSATRPAIIGAPQSAPAVPLELANTDSSPRHVQGAPLRRIGLVVPAEQVEVRAPYDGLIATRSKGVGERVSAGEVVAVIDDAEVAADRDRVRARAAAIAHRATAAGAEVRLLENRGEQLRASLEKRAAAAFEVAENRYQAEASAARLKALEEERREAEMEGRALDRRIANHRCLAPIAGVVSEAPRGTGECVRVGETILKIQSGRRLIRVNVPATASAGPAEVSIHWVGRRARRQLKVVQVSPELNLNGDRPVLLEAPDDAELAVGQAVDVEVVAP